MNIKVNENEYELNTKLGTCIEIQKAFKKPYLKVIENVMELNLEDQIKFIACGLTYKESKDEFKEDILECGIDTLVEIIEQYVDALQYPGLTEEEIETKKLARAAKAKHLKEIGLMN